MSTPRTRRVRAAKRLTAPPTRDQAEYARTLCENVAAIEDPLTLERWASSFLGRTWERGRRHHGEMEQDHGFALGAAIVEAIADVGGPGAAAALLAISQLSDDCVGEHAASWAKQIEDSSVPDWVAKVGQANVIRALVAHSPCESEVVFIEADQPGFGLHTVVVYIDDQWGGIAKHVALLRPVDSIRASFEAELTGRGGLIQAEPELACRRILHAIWLTDERPGLTVGDTYADLRGIAVARACAGPAPPPKRRTRSVQ
jgi:hypothetical protein